MWYLSVFPFRWLTGILNLIYGDVEYLLQLRSLFIFLFLIVASSSDIHVASFIPWEERKARRNMVGECSPHATSDPTNEVCIAGYTEMEYFQIQYPALDF